jgi:1-acyl-sn-glycerol-3-phosphate acyltransferase
MALSEESETAGTQATEDDDSEPKRPTIPIEFRVDPTKKILYRIGRIGVNVGLGLWFRPRVRTARPVPPIGAVILAPVHRSYIDFLFTGLLTDRKLFFMVKEEAFTRRWFATTFFPALGMFPVNRSGVDRVAMRRAEEVLERGQVLVVFPEGSRRSGPAIDELAEGVAFLSARCGVPIQPVGLAPTEEILPKGTRFPKPLTVTVTLGEPIEPPAQTSGGRVARSQVKALTEKLRERLQAAYDEARGG